MKLGAFFVSYIRTFFRTYFVLLIYLTMVNFSYRQQAIDWLNSKRDFNEGILLMEATGFRPSVIAKLKKHGAKGPDAAHRMTRVIRLYIQVCSGGQDTGEDFDTGINASVDNPEITSDATTVKIAEAAHLIEEGKMEVPESVASVVARYAEAYKRRDILHKQLAELPEDNSEDTMASRKALVEEIEECSNIMETLYPKYETYIQKGKEPELESLENSEESSKNGEESSKNGDESSKDSERDNAEVPLEGKSKEELQKLRKSVAAKISKANNMLQYQQEKKGETPNPMPECPKRVKYETKIQKLSKELEAIEYAIARC